MPTREYPLGTSLWIYRRDGRRRRKLAGFALLERTSRGLYVFWFHQMTRRRVSIGSVLVLNHKAFGLTMVFRRLSIRTLSDVTSFGQPGHGGGEEIYLPRNMTITPQGFIYVSDEFNHRVKAFSIDPDNGFQVSLIQTLGHQESGDYVQAGPIIRGVDKDYGTDSTYYDDYAGDPAVRQTPVSGLRPALPARSANCRGQSVASDPRSVTANETTDPALNRCQGVPTCRQPPVPHPSVQ